MPLTAIVDGKRIVGSEVSESAWSDLKTATRSKASLVRLQCGKPGHCRTSKLGTQFFAHNAGAGRCDDHPGEGPEHLLAKSIIVRAALGLGWEAEPEFRGDGWVADVLAWQGSQRVAFEVQWSSQTEATYRSRQEGRARAGIRTAWFVRHEHSIPEQARAELPVFKLRLDYPSPTVQIESASLSLADAVQRLLSGKVKYRSVASGFVFAPQVDLYWNKCWRCQKWSIFWDLAEAEASTPCGEAFYTRRALHNETRPEEAPEVQAAVLEHCKRSGWTPSRVLTRWSKTAGKSYSGFVCSHCDALQGDVPLQENLDWREPKVSLQLSDSLQVQTDHRHWCQDSGSGFC